MYVDQLRLPTAQPVHCHLYRALGYDRPCPGSDCVFFRVPGVDGCAIEQWGSGIDGHPARAAWFLARRIEAEEARARREEQFGLDAGRDPAITPQAADTRAARRGQGGGHG
jgi:hypothetical protein